MSHRPLRLAAVAALACLAASCLDSSALTDVPSTPGSSPVKWVLVQPAVATIAPGKQLALDVSLQDAAGRVLSGLPVTWKSSDSAVASVDDSGVVTAHKVGAVHVSAKSGNTSAFANVTVSTAAPPQLTVSITPASDTVVVQGAVQLFASVRDAQGNLATNVKVAFTSSNMNVATVSVSGVVTGVGVGAARITATAGTGSATAQITVMNAADTSSGTSAPPPSSPPPSAGTLYDGYSAVSPHWPHIRTMMTDFYYGWTSTERVWAGEHYDYAMSGDGAAWVAANPTITHLPYALEWTTKISGTAGGQAPTAYYADMVTWYAAHSQYKLETAFLHQQGAPADSAHRLVTTIWNSQRWLLNPADSGLIAYQVDRFSRIATGEGGVFLDEEGSGNILSNVAASAEYPADSGYAAPHTALLRAIKKALGSKMLMLNLAQYTTPFDRDNAIAAGAVHLEKTNNPVFSGTYAVWQWIGTLNANGVFVDFVSTYASSEEAAMASSIPPGNEVSTVARLKMWELASYYMAVGPSPDLLSLHLETLWNQPYSTLWLKAQEANIGHPAGDRTILARGTDPLGQGYTIYSRDFDRALVLLRHQSGWGTQSYVDASAVRVPLPPGQTWLPLHADGTLGAPVTSILLRNSEAAILIKQSTIQ